MYKIGLSTFAFPVDEESFKKLREQNIESIEISFPSHMYSEINYDKLKSLSETYGIELWTYHLPFSPFSEIELSTPDAAVRDSTLKYFSELIKKGTDIGIDKFVVHSSGEVIEDYEREERMKYAMDSLNELAETAFKNNAVIAVEDLPRTCLGKNSEEIKRLISVNDNLRVCLDTNHLFSEDVAKFIENLADKIITLHISDFDFINERHWLPGEGKLDWQSIITALRNANYNGVWMYEIPFACPKSIIRRDLTFSDVSRNAKEIFENKKITTFCEHIENLGMWV